MEPTLSVQATSNHHSSLAQISTEEPSAELRVRGYDSCTVGLLYHILHLFCQKDPTTPAKQNIEHKEYKVALRGLAFWQKGIRDRPDQRLQFKRFLHQHRIRRDSQGLVDFSG